MAKKPIEKIIEDLQGTCGSADLDDYSMKELQQLDDAIRLCDGCGWWCETSEMKIDDDGQNCEQCCEDQ